MNIQQLRERYAAPEIPKCRVCGGVLTVQRAGGGPTIWGCTGMIDDPTGERNWIYAEGRSCADEHYERSRWSDYRQGGDAEVIELIEALEAAERERDELRAIAEEQSKLAGSNAARAQKAKEELARRDAAAGEPGAYQIHSDLEGWRECTPERYAEVSSRPLVDGKHSGGWLVRKLYTAAPPAVLPPEKITEIMQDAWNEFCDDTGCYPDDFEYQNEQLFFDAGRWAMLVAERISSLGAQQQKVVELHKRKSTEVISGQRYSYVLLEDLLPELDAAGVKWEVKK